MIHVGHDEWRMEKDVCELCRGKDYNELYAKDLTKIYQYLKKRGIQVAIWGDHLMESVYGKDFQVWKTSTGYQYKIPASLRPSQVDSLIPKDILVFNWFWNDVNNDKQLSKFGFRQVYGNLRPDISNWTDRSKINGVLGGAPSSWAATTEFNIGKDQLSDFLGGANLLWSKHPGTRQGRL
jgi:hexosaminidase